MPEGGCVVDGVRRLLVARPRLTTLLDSVADRRLVCVVGDAASGKTTAVRDWATTRDEPHAWVTVRASRDDPRHLLAELIAATEAWCPGLREVLEPELDARAAGGRADDPLELAAVLAGALAAAWGERASAPFTVVVDDFDEVVDPAGVAFVADLVRQYPRTVRMLVLSRSALPFAVHRLDAAGEFAEVGPRALRFDADETGRLFAGAGVPIPAGDAQAITDACGGWAGALRLAVESSLVHGSADLAARLGTSSAPAFLASVALRQLDDRERRAVRLLSVLGRIERPVLTDRPDLTAQLDALAERGLLVLADADGWALTALASYATDIALPVTPAEAAEVFGDGIALALDAGQAETALQWATRLGDPDLLRSTLARAGWSLLDSGSSVLGDAAEQLPRPIGDVELDGLLASHFAARGDMDLAHRYLGGAGDARPLPAAVGWRIAMALWMHGDASAAQALLARVDGSGGPVDEARLAATRATLAWGRGDGTAARRAADDALNRARASGNQGALAMAWVNQALVAALEGDLARNQRCYSTALEHAIAAHDVLTQLRVRCNVGSRLTEIGQYREAVAELDEALRLGEATGQRTRIALARLNQGQARAGLGRLTEALQDIEAALAIWAELGSPMSAFAHQTMGDVLARRGDRTRAVRAYRAAVQAAELQHDAQTLAPAVAGLARCLVADDHAEAQRLAERAVTEPAALGSVVALLAAGWVALHGADRAAAAEHARQARDEAARRDDPASLSQALLLGVLSEPAPTPTDARLSEARALMEEIGDEIALDELDVVVANLGLDRTADERAWARLRAAGVRDSAALVAGPLAVLHERRRASVSIRTLGTFAVLRGEQPVPASAWQSRKARDLVKILAARRGKAITREALADLLWPDGRGDASGNRLSVALSTARAVFDPDKVAPADHVIVADREAVRLNAAVATDIERYQALSQAALSATAGGGSDARALLERAAAAYSGDFCEEDPYEAWAAQPRDELRARHQEVLRTLADVLGRSGNPGSAVPWLIALLGLDPFDEATHLRLVGTLARAGRHGEARRSYRAYVERMAEIDVEPAAFPQPTRHRS